MSKLNIKALLESKHLYAKDVALKYFNCPNADEKEIRSKAVMFTQMFGGKANPTLASLQKLAEVLGVDILQLFEPDQAGVIDFVSPETGRHYKMIPMD